MTNAHPCYALVLQVSLVTDMSYLLGNYSDSSNTLSSCRATFNSDISNWDVSSVTSMRYVASSFSFISLTEHTQYERPLLSHCCYHNHVHRTARRRFVR